MSQTANILLAGNKARMMTRPSAHGQVRRALPPLRGATAPLANRPETVLREAWRRGISSDTTFQALGKRLIDVVVAAAMLVLLAVPMAVVALLIKLSSPGPVLYRQDRVGRGGRHFTLLKFRTMHSDAEKATGPVWAVRNDPRRTPYGAVLRRFSIDELPQLINILRGDMSLVGPRPERPCFVEQFSHELHDYALRHAGVPGLSGWAQLNGLRGDTSLSERLEFDLYYLRNRSLLFDLYIILLTPFKVLFDKNAC